MQRTPRKINIQICITATKSKNVVTNYFYYSTNAVPSNSHPFAVQCRNSGYELTALGKNRSGKNRYSDKGRGTLMKMRRTGKVYECLARQNVLMELLLLFQKIIHRNIRG